MTDECVIKRGKYKNIAWLLTNDGTLTVTGKGDMPDFEPDSFRRRSVTPWYRCGCEKKIKKFFNGELKSVSKGARKIAEACDIKTVGKQLKEVYEEVLKKED